MWAGHEMGDYKYLAWLMDWAQTWYDYNDCENPFVKTKEAKGRMVDMDSRAES